MNFIYIGLPLSSNTGIQIKFQGTFYGYKENLLNVLFYLVYIYIFFLISFDACVLLFLVDQHDIDNEIDAKFLIAAFSTVFLSMSLEIVGALIIEYIRGRPEIYQYIDRELLNFLEVSFL